MTLRCLMLCWEYPPVVEGGLGRHVGQLVPELGAAGIEVHVLTRGTAAADDEDRVHRVPEPPWPDEIGRFVAWVEQMNDHLLAAGERLAERVGFDLVHGHDWLVGRAGERLARRLGVPLLMTIHATEHGRHAGWVGEEPQAGIDAAERRTIRGAEHVIVCSEYMRDHLADVFGVDERAISVIANGVRPVTTVRRAQPGLILLAGRLVYEKGFQLALATLPGLRERVGPLRLVIAGAGIHEGALRATADELGIEPYVTFRGWVEDLGELYATADLCVVPSIYEPFGMVALEAMAHRCPCVAADTGGLREIVPHGEVGLRFAAGDAASLAAMVELMLGGGALRERLVASAGEHVRAFDWAVIGARTAEVYRGVCAAAGPRTPQ